MDSPLADDLSSRVISYLDIDEKVRIGIKPGRLVQTANALPFLRPVVLSDTVSRLNLPVPCPIGYKTITVSVLSHSTLRSTTVLLHHDGPNSPILLGYFVETDYDNTMMSLCIGVTP
jgi:hypothetical protein